MISAKNNYTPLNKKYTTDVTDNYEKCDSIEMFDIYCNKKNVDSPLN